jgi:hypothetical protein
MKRQEINIYREIQHNSENAIKTIDALAEKIYDDTFAVQMAAQSLRYSEIRNEAVDELLKAGETAYRGSYMEDMALKGSIGYRTLINTSLSRIAEIMIDENNSGIMNMEKALNHNDNIGKKPEQLARKLIEMQERTRACLKDYL